MSSIQIHAKATGHLHLREGEFRVGRRRMATPHFYTIINVITGPPPLMANGGVWK